MLLSIALASVLSPAPRPRVPAQAAVRIVNAVRVTKDEWGQSTRKREITIVEEERPVVVRLIEFE